MKRYTTRAEEVEVGFDFAVTAFQFLEQHAQVLRRMGITYRTDQCSDNVSTSHCELVDTAGKVIASVTLVVEQDGLALLTAECSLGEGLHTCLATKWKASA